MRTMRRFLVNHRWLLAVLLASTVFAAVCAKLNTSGNLTVAGATSHVMIDYPNASIVDRSAIGTAQDDLALLQQHATLYASLMTTPPVLDAIGKRMGVPGGRISGIADITVPAPIQFTMAGSEEHASQLVASEAPYRLELQPSLSEPILTIYAEAPSVDGALRLATSASLGLGDYLRSVAQQQGFPRQELPQLRALGSPRGGVSNSKAKLEIAGLTFITAFALSFVVLLLLLRRRWRGAERDSSRPPRRSRLTGRAAADWPRTTRLLPWSIAGLIAMIWLTPFDRLQLGGGGAPINITLDRVVIPIVAVIWLIAFTAGPGAAPRLQLTRVHLAMGAYLTCAFLSVVLDAHFLNHTGELAISVKKVPLLVSYVSIFVIVASSIRRSEVRAFITFTLVLAVIVGLEAIYEYHTHQDLFLTLLGHLGPFKLSAADTANATVLDSQGRFDLQGPTDYGAELVGILSMALAIALLRFLKATSLRQRILYGVPIGLLPYAMFATERKTALVAPAIAFLTIAYFRRRRLLSLAPLILVLAVGAVAISPQTFGHVVSQFTGADATKTATVDARTANFDAVRPDLWSHLLLGRGQGSYAPPNDRIVDSDIILPLIETGVLGLAAFLLIPLSLFSLARRKASEPSEADSTAALVGVTAATILLCLATLYSFMSLPHGPDVFMYLAGLTVVALGSDGEPRGVPRARHHRLARGDRRRIGHPAPILTAPAQQLRHRA
ncbi:MAG: O-antigen ligase family protein [Solirubrobacteraceae bacterium]